MTILLVNLHSSRNAGDLALTVEAIRQVKRKFGEPVITLAMNDPASHHETEEAIGSFYTWVRTHAADGTPSWRWLAIPRLFLLTLLAALTWRASGRLPRLGLSEPQQRLLRAYTEADVVLSCAGNIFYTSGRIGFPFLLALYTVAFARLLGKPTYTLPQSFGPLHHHWEKTLLRWLLMQLRGVQVREPRSVALLDSIGVPAAKRALVPDLGFSFAERDEARAEVLLRDLLGPALGASPLLGITVINWGAQSIRFGRQEPYEAAIAAAIERFLAETEGTVVLFAQVWGPTEQEDDRIPARRIAARFAGSGRVFMLDQPLDAATLKSCYARLELLLGTRMHSNIFALSEGTPVVAIGYHAKTRGIMEMVGLDEWVLDIEKVSAATLADRVMVAWHARGTLRAHVARVLPAIQQGASQAVARIRDDLAAQR